MLRVAAVSYFNSRPLLGNLAERGDLVLSEMPPAAVAAALMAGEADVGLVPCAALLDDESLTYIPGLCIGARGPVDSVFLWVRAERLEGKNMKPGGQLSIGLDPHSRTSRLLTRLWLEEFQGMNPENLIYENISPRELLADAPRRAALDAFLVIGDLAMMHEAGPDFVAVDLAEIWQEQTGLPFVFAVWGLNRTLLEARPELAEIFQEALSFGLAKLESYVEQAQTERGLDPDRSRRYLNERILYRMDDEAERGLQTFLAKARRLESNGKNCRSRAEPAEE